jgi:hypothetical protein
VLFWCMAWCRCEPSCWHMPVCCDDSCATNLPSCLLAWDKAPRAWAHIYGIRHPLPLGLGFEIEERQFRKEPMMGCKLGRSVSKAFLVWGPRRQATGRGSWYSTDAAWRTLLAPPDGPDNTSSTGQPNKPSKVRSTPDGIPYTTISLNPPSNPQLFVLLRGTG